MYVMHASRTPQNILEFELICRNVPFDIDEESLEDEFSEYGKINYVKIVVNPKTGQPKGNTKRKEIYCIFNIHTVSLHFSDPLKTFAP